MMRGVFDRSVLALSTLALAAIGLASPAYADPPCPSGGCTHGPSNSPSYKDGYKTEHDYFAIPQNHAYLMSEMRNGYNTGLVCQTEISGGPKPASPADWISGCVDALHDLGFTP